MHRTPSADLPEPPVARKIPTVEAVHGDTRQDDYSWLRREDHPEEAPGWRPAPGSLGAGGD